MFLEDVKKISMIFFEKLCIEIDNLEVIQEGEKIYYIKLKTKDSGILIGYSGKNLDDLRIMLKSILTKIISSNIVLHIEVNDYLSKKEDKLHNFIMKKVQIAKQGKEVILPFFNAYERKRIHSYICSLNEEEIYTKSLGEGENRRLHIFKKNKNLTIDMDGIDI